MASGSYGLKDACRIVGATRSQVEYWVRSRIITPQLPSTGTGTYRNFSFANLIELEVCRVLALSGVGVEELRTATEFALKNVDPDDWSNNGPKQRAAFEQMERNRLAHFGAEEVARRDKEFADAMAIYHAEQLAWFNKHGATDAVMAKILARWRAFKNPVTRGELIYYLSRLPLGGRMAMWTLATSDDILEQVPSRPYIHALNLKPIFERIEKETGDHWRTWSELVTK